MRRQILSSRVPASALALVLAACASDTNRPIGPSEAILLTLQPARITPHPSGALLLSSLTGCYIEFVGAGPAEPVYEFRVAPTRRVPSIEQCLESLRSQPGVTAVARSAK
jgi:hypothetical protein